MKKIIAMLMAVLVVFSVTACGGKKMETFGMSAQSFIDSYNANAEKNMLKDPDSPAAALMDLFLFEDATASSNETLENGMEAEIYECGSVLGDESTFGCKIMTESKSKEVIYVEIWANTEMVNEKFMPYITMMYWCMVNTINEDVTESEFQKMFEEIVASTNESGTGFEKKYGEYCYKGGAYSDDKFCFALTTSEYADMTR